MKKLVDFVGTIIPWAVGLAFSPSAGAQTSTDVYNSIVARPSSIRWCTPEAGDDPAHIISSRCRIYRECLSGLGLDESIDKNPFPPIASDHTDGVRNCHQALYNAARVNPQIKGSGATQQWLLHSVHPDTEAKSFAVPNGSADPR